MPAVPAHADTLARLPSRRDARADGIDDSGDLVSGNAWVLNSRKNSFFGDRIAVADSTGLNLDAYCSGAGLGDVTFYDFQRAVGA
jgi:hypothetical protein